MGNYNIFLGHSGPNSLKIANALHKMITDIFGKARPYISEENIPKGRQWMNDLREKLGEVALGIICITPHNSKMPWIHFEAGALFCSPKKPSICPYLCGVTPNILTHTPLSDFQTTLANKPDTLRLLKHVRETIKDDINEQRLINNFNLQWTILNQSLVSIRQSSSPLSGLAADLAKSPLPHIPNPLPSLGDHLNSLRKLGEK